MNDDWLKEQNEKIFHVLWIIFISMITAVITTLLLKVSIGL